MLEFWLLVALIVLIAVLWKPMREKAIGGLDERAEKIRAELDEAQRLHEEAKGMLAKHQRQLREGESLADDIRKRAESETKRLEAKMKADYENMVERRTQQAEERIAQEEARAVQLVRSRAARLAVATTRQILAEELEGDRAKKVMQGAIDEVKQKLA